MKQASVSSADQGGGKRRVCDVLNPRACATTVAPFGAASSPSNRAARQNGGSRLDHQSTGVIGPLPYCDSCIIK
jgi:hypothetical protein